MLKCKWCGSNMLSCFQPFSTSSSFYAYQALSEYKRWLCLKCGSMGYITDPSLIQLENIYVNAWNGDSAAGRFASGSTSSVIAESLISTIIGNMDVGKCLDYGGGNGSLAQSLKNLNSDVYVFEPYGKPINDTRLIWLKSWDQLPTNIIFDWIFMIEVIEHLLNPVQELKKIREHLAPNGKLLITTPNATGWRARIEGEKWREALNPTHINLFSPGSLILFLHRAGFSNIHRSLRPVRYHQTFLSTLALSLTQLFGIDGSIRVIATP